MANSLQQSGANLPASDFAPIHTNRMITGMWSNSNPLRDAAIPFYTEKAYGGRQDRIKDGHDCEISPRLTLIRRKGLSVYNSQDFPPTRRYYGWNTFDLTNEFVRVMVDTDATVYDGTGPNTKINVFDKSPSAIGRKTYFLGVGNTLYFTNGVDSKQLVNGSGNVWDWGVTAPTNAPSATQTPRPNPYPNWTPNTAHAFYVPVAPYGTVNPAFANNVAIVDPGGNLQLFGFLGVMNAGAPPKSGVLGVTAPTAWSNAVGGETLDGNINWTCWGPSIWQANPHRNVGEMCVVSPVSPPPGTPNQLMFVCTTPGDTGFPPQPKWPLGVGQQVSEGDAIWTNVGAALQWSDVGAPGGNAITTAPQSVDAKGYLQTVYQQGRTAPTQPSWVDEPGALTVETGTTLIWQNSGPFAVPGTAPSRYGYAFMNPETKDISEMSPASAPITVIQGNQVQVQGDGSTQPGATIVIIYRTEQSGAIFFYLDQIDNPPAGQKWTYLDSTPDSGLNIEIQAQVLGEGTPPPAGATCMEYHLGRIFVAAGNVVYGSSGPDAVVATSSGNAGFNLSFTAQSKVTRLWANSIGLLVYTVRDTYIILQDSNTGTLFMQKWIEQMPLLSYDAFALLHTVPHIFTGYRTVLGLDPSAGIVEHSFPIADKVAGIDPATAYCTILTGPSGETALYLSDGATLWYRMAPTSAPESGILWSPVAYPVGGMSAIQATEVLPGVTVLLVGPAVSGPILQRDVNVNTDNGQAFTVEAEIGSIVLAQPSQLAGLAWMTLEATNNGTAPALGVLLDEIDGEFENVPRTRQDPPNMTPSTTLQSNRHSLLQNQRPVWCRHMQYSISWPAEDAANELLTTTIYGQTWAEQRSQ